MRIDYYHECLCWFFICLLLGCGDAVEKQILNPSHNKHPHHQNPSQGHLRNQYIYLRNREQYFRLWRHQNIGRDDKIPNIGVYGAAVMSDLGTFMTLDLQQEEIFLAVRDMLNTTRQNTTYDPVKYGKHMDMATFSELLKMRELAERVIVRIENMQYLESFLPFPLQKWSAIYTTPCPLFPGTNPVERGLAWAHYRIWRDFSYFDETLLSLQAENQTIMSRDGRFLLDGDGKLYKYGLEFRWTDRIVIFEDDVVHAIRELNSTLLEELTDMNTIDILYLGWCEGRAAKPVPLCSHSYAITREGARKLVQYFEPCGRAVDEQFVIIIKNGWLKYRRAHSYSYGANIIRPDFPCHSDRTRGIFRQCKNLFGSFQGH